MLFVCEYNYIDSDAYDNCYLNRQLNIIYDNFSQNMILTLSIHNPAGLDPVEIIEQLPVGWKIKFKSDITDLYDILQTPLVALDIRDGVLYLTQSDTGLHKKLTAHIIRSIAQESSRTCMVCGKFARRRKEQAHKPALCREHYIEYINTAED